ncbi:MAG TPA: hypothetical protein VHB48_19000, partial [Chitinophagaceae bacterium]|nr:hypothetical protein [Chitinophagaceae bacterium]
YRYYKTKVDSLLQAGCELHYFNPGFEKTDINTATNTKGDAARHDNYWHTVRQLLAVAGTQRPLYIFSSSYLHNFNGIRPAMPPTVHWLLYTPADTAAFTSSAFENAAGGITTITTRTSAAGSNNIYADIPGSEAKKITGITPDTATLRVSMYASAGIADAAYIKAAIAAIQQYSNRKITFTACSSPSLLPAKQNWLFWLSTDDPPAGIQANNILRYQKGREEDIQSSLLTAGNPSLYKRIIPAETNTINNIVWADGFGNPILQKEAGPQNTYHFYSRFNTVWTDLVWSNEFTNVLYKLLYGEDATPAAQGFKDLRMADSNQLSPYITVKPITAAKNGAKDISWLFWLAAFIVLSAERMIALTPKKRGAHA